MRNIRFQAESYFRPLTLAVSLNDQPLGTFHISQPWTLQPIDLGSPMLRQGNNVLILHVVEGCSLPRQYEPANQDPRCFSVGMQQLRVAPLAPSA